MFVNIIIIMFRPIGACYKYYNAILCILRLPNCAYIAVPLPFSSFPLGREKKRKCAKDIQTANRGIVNKPPLKFTRSFLYILMEISKMIGKDHKIDMLITSNRLLPSSFREISYFLFL